MVPSIGRIVHYRLSADDAESINRRRQDFLAYNKKHRTNNYGGMPMPGEPGRTGHIGHFGNVVSEGDIFPAMIVRVWGEDTACVNLQVYLDGNDTYWATSALQGDGNRQWFQPPKVDN